MLRIGIIGCGAIGGEICRAIDRGAVETDPVGVSDIDPSKALALAHGLRKPPPLLSPVEVIEAAELVVEAVSMAVAHRNLPLDI
jgi:aspartate dehydrogenase